ncbi:hypothetical protein GR211_22135 [Rhizobium leguminosarum]|uniref:spike base protein, RCAP_Rcc01079 family n=1 Tax=Rhizobium ruizarguesonis TaxID=2081791 RepID=UPI0013BA06FC|nr:hypothetical protein [Rhizobium ruizarguesonis]NEJ15520.1 hypothetical protein [Rhizobium ruizarguesonis]NEK29595.1 hypothetical protein [Rhizobium ruizarguesonis]
MFDRQQSIREARAVDLSTSDDAMPTNSPTRSVFVGVGGTLVVELVGKPGVSVTYTIATGTSRPLAVSKFIKIGTSATGIIAEF